MGVREKSGTPILTWEGREHAVVEIPGIQGKGVRADSVFDNPGGLK